MAKRSPRLLFTEEELEAPEVGKAAGKAEKANKKLEKAESKIPKKKVVKKQRVYDSKENTVVTRLVFEENEKKRPSKLTQGVTRAPVNTVSAASHKLIYENTNENAGAEVSQDVVNGAEGGVRTLDTAHRTLKDRPYAKALMAERAADRANIRALYRQAEIKNGGFSTNPYSRFQQKRAIRKGYAEAKARGAAAAYTGSYTVKASEVSAKAMRKTGKKTRNTSTFIASHKTGLLMVGVAALVILMCASMFSSCSLMMSSVVTSTTLSTYPSADADMLAAEEQYTALEAELQDDLDNYESAHDYDEYVYDLDDIEHDPYVLISLVTSMVGGEWTIDEVEDILQTLFNMQYTLTETVTTETRYRTETRVGIDPDTLESYEYEEEVAYEYRICTVTLENYDLSHIPVLVLNEDGLSLYSTYMSTLGNRPDLFADSGYVALYYGTTEYSGYSVPADALEDEQFALMIAEAEKYLGYPYVWGGSSPSTSFDCSGFVCWVINNCGVGWNIGRTTAEGLRSICSYVSAEDAQPGDLIFFQGTYNTSGASHVGIYVGNGMMIHCGDPIQYTSINTSYWQTHFLAYGRLPSP